MVDILRVLNQPGWDYRLTHEGVSIKAPTRRDASLFARRYADALTETAVKLKGSVRVGWRKCKQPLEFHGWMTAAQQPTPDMTAEAILSFQGSLFDGTIYCSQARCPIELLKRNVSAGESEKPIGITRHHDGMLIMLNKPLEVLKETPAPEACLIPVKDLWRPADFAELQRRWQIQRQFDWAYDAALNPRLWANLYTNFERFQAEDGLWYAVNVINFAEPVPFPSDVILAVS